jgi:hypothetical protein
MSQPQQYQSPITRAVVRLVEMAIKGEDSPPADKKKNLVMTIAWNMVRSQLPMVLYGLDHDPKALAAIQGEILLVSQENLKAERGPGYLAWISPGEIAGSDRTIRLCPEDSNGQSGNQKLG